MVLHNNLTFLDQLSFNQEHANVDSDWKNDPKNIEKSPKSIGFFSDIKFRF